MVFPPTRGPSYRERLSSSFEWNVQIATVGNSVLLCEYIQRIDDWGVSTCHFLPVFLLVSFCSLLLDASRTFCTSHLPPGGVSFPIWFVHLYPVSKEKYGSDLQQIDRCSSSRGLWHCSYLHDLAGLSCHLAPCVSVGTYCLPIKMTNPQFLKVLWLSQ